MLKLADYLSPMARAKRKAAIAKANYEHWLYSSGAARTQKDQMWYMKVSQFNRARQKQALDMRKTELQIQKLEASDDGSLPGGPKKPRRQTLKEERRKSTPPLAAAPASRAFVEPELPAPELPEVIAEEEEEETE